MPVFGRVGPPRPTLQTYANHTRLVLPYHFVCAPIFLLNLGWAVYRRVTINELQTFIATRTEDGSFARRLQDYRIRHGIRQTAARTGRRREGARAARQR